MQIKAAHNRNIDIACVQSLKGFVCDTIDNAAKQKLKLSEKTGCCIYIAPRIPQTVPFGAREQWAAAVARKIDGLLSATGQAGTVNADAALDDLLSLPAQALDTRARGHARRTLARLRRIENGEPLDNEPRHLHPPRTVPQGRPHPPLPRHGQHLSGRKIPRSPTHPGPHRGSVPRTASPAPPRTRPAHADT
jgi:hypothetical protein